MTTATNTNTDSPLATEIWSPSSAANLSLVFSPLFGAYLHHRNWLALGEQERAATAKKWVFAGAGLLVLTTLGALADKNLSGLWLVFLFAWYFAAAKSQVKYVKERWGDSFQRKSMARPILIALAGLVVYIGIFAGAATLDDSTGANATAAESEMATAEQKSPEIPTIAFENFFVDFNEYVNQEVAIEGLLLTTGDVTFLYKEMGSTTFFMVENANLSREEKKLLIAECSNGCQAKLAVHAISGSNPKAVQALRLLP